MHDVPRDLEVWLDGYWTLRHTSDFFVAAKKGLLQSFVIQDRFTAWDRVPHELAHLVCCEDKDIMDPCWGIPEFNFYDYETGEETKLSAEAQRKEVEVVAVEELIHIHRSTSLTVCSEDIAAIIIGTGPLIRSELVALAETYLDKWDIQKVWAELNRKYRLVDEYLLSEG